MTIQFWETESGRNPVGSFIAKLAVTDPKAAARLSKDIDYLEERGLNLLGNTDKVRELKGYKNLFELKSILRGVYVRILFCVSDGDIWMLEAFKKKTNHTPDRYIKTALSRRDSLPGTHRKIGG